MTWFFETIAYVALGTIVACTGVIAVGCVCATVFGVVEAVQASEAVVKRALAKWHDK